MTEALAAIAPWLIVAALCLLVGAALGYYTAATDLEDEREKARAQGFDEGIATAWDLLGFEGRKAYRERHPSARRIVPDDEQEHA